MSKKRGSSSLNRPVKRILLETSARTSDEVMRKLIAADPSKQRLSKKILRKGVCDTINFLKKNDLDVIQKFKDVSPPMMDVSPQSEEKEDTVIPQKLNATLYAANATKKDKRKKVKKPKKKRRVASSSGAGGMYMNGTGGDGDQDTPTSYKVKRPSQRVSDLAGIDNILIQIRELIQYPLLHPEIYDTLQIKPPRGVLLHGPPGCGKTMLATAIGGELGHTVQFFRLSAPEVVSWRSGDTERNIRALFKEAKECAPSLVFIDEIDAIAGKRTTGRGMDRRIVSQLLTEMDKIGEDEEDEDDNDDVSTKTEENGEEISPSRKRKRQNSTEENEKQEDKAEAKKSCSVLVIGTCGILECRGQKNSITFTHLISLEQSTLENS